MELSTYTRSVPMAVSQESLFPERKRLSPLERYLADLGSDKSRRVQLSALRTVAHILRSEPVEPHTLQWGSINDDDVAILRTKLIARFPPETARHYMSALRSVCLRARMMGEMSAEMLERIRAVPRINGKSIARKRPLERPEVRKVLRTCARIGTPIAIRDAAIVATFYFTGVRRDELCRIHMRDIDLRRGIVRVTGKGNKQRLASGFTRGSKARAILAEWLNLRGLGPGPLFRRVLDGRVQPEGLSGNSIWRIIRDRMAEMELEHASPHDLRRTFATHLAKAGVKLQVLADMLGHESLDTTRIYIDRDFADQQKAAALLDR